MTKLVFFATIAVAYVALLVWAEARDARDWLAHMRKGMEPRS